MASRIEARLAELGILLPQAGAPAANYVPFVRTGDLLFVSGQVCALSGKLSHVGKLGKDFSVEEGQKAARICGLNLLAHLKNALDGDLDRVVRCVRLGGFVNGTADFIDQPKVINGCSDLMVEVFGEAGRHARTAVGTNALPFDVAVEVEGCFEVR